MWGSRRPRLAALAGALAAFACVATTKADGEAGLVIQEGDGVTTYCVAFEGDGIRGDALLRAAGRTFDAYGGGSGLAVCSIDGNGCDDASSFSSCFCQCKGATCTYWAFFTRDYGKDWVYSVLAFNLLEAADGEVHGWKWGAGGANSAPAPRDVTFEQICGHAPRGGAPPTATATVSRPTAAVTIVPAATATTPNTTGGAAIGTPDVSPSPPLVTITNSAATPAGGATTTPSVPASGSAEEEAGPGTQALVLFGSLVAALVALLGLGLLWRARHGA